MEKQFEDLLKRISSVDVAVCGDFCLDVYWDMDPAGSEVSVETGRRAEAVARHYYSPGGAGNVAANIAALQPKSLRAIGVIGADMHGRELTAQLQALRIDTGGLLPQADHFATYAFNKKYFGGEETLRSDFGVHNRRSRHTEQALLQHLRRALEECQVLVFNQQVPGSLPHAEFIAEANTLFAAFPQRIILLDSRHYPAHFRGVSFKLNDVEAARLNGRAATATDHIPLADVQRYGLELWRRQQRPIFITCGSRGILAVDGGEARQVPALQVGSRIDTVGAGDTVLSALALALGAGSSPLQAAGLANCAAAVSIQKLQTTGTASPGEILDLSREAYYIYRPELAQDLRRARYLPDVEIECCDETVMEQLGRVQHAVFDHDGTISTLREGWEQVMEPVMIESILGPGYAQADARLLEKVRRRCQEYIHESTGIQTILQMETLVRMVQEFGLVPPDQILDKSGYKARYNEALLQMVGQRVAKFRKGELQVADVTMKGAVDFLHALRNRGVALYLASGTDRDDVVREAELLGYAGLFEGRIYGAVGDIKQYSKKMVIDQIIRSNGLQGPELVVLGDGPVEIQEGRRFGGITVGIAGDEPRRYGLNRAKRTRLIRAGAHLIVPDFSQGKHLLSLLLSPEQ